MKVRPGYILLEVIVCTFIMSMLIMVLYSIIISAINTKDNIEDKIELNQQAEEMEYHIKNIVENSINIINITTTDNEVIETLQENKTYNVLSIKLNFKSDDENINSKNKKDNQEISFKRDLKKIFINTLYDDNSNKAGGYEIGDYVESIKIKIESSKLICIIINLEKDKVTLEKEMKLFIKSNE